MHCGPGLLTPPRSCRTRRNRCRGGLGCCRTKSRTCSHTRRLCDTRRGVAGLWSEKAGRAGRAWLCGWLNEGRLGWVRGQARGRSGQAPWHDGLPRPAQALRHRALKSRRRMTATNTSTSCAPGTTVRRTLPSDSGFSGSGTSALVFFHSTDRFSKLLELAVFRAQRPRIGALAASLDQTLGRHPNTHVQCVACS